MLLLKKKKNTGRPKRDSIPETLIFLTSQEDILKINEDNRQRIMTAADRLIKAFKHRSHFLFEPTNVF